MSLTLGVLWPGSVELHRWRAFRARWYALSQADEDAAWAWRDFWWPRWTATITGIDP